MVEPYSFLIIELGSVERTLADIEGIYKFFEGEKLLFGSRIPAQQGQKVNDSLGEIAAFAIARSHFSGLGVVPFQRENGETEPISVAFTQLAFAFWLEQQG